MFKGRKLVTLFVSLLAAGILWLYVVTTVAPETSGRVANIPVTIDGSIILEERGLIITDQETTNVTLEITTSRQNLSKLNASNIRISADASKIREAGTYDLSYTVVFPDTVNSNDVDIVRKSSDRVTITVAKLETKLLPIEVDWMGSKVEEGYSAETSSAEWKPEEITLIGPDYELEKINSARISFDYSNLKETVSEQIVQVLFEDADDGKYKTLEEFTSFTTASAEEASLTLQILRTKQIKMAVELVPGGGVDEDHAKVTINPSSIDVKGNTETIEAMPDVMMIGTPIDLARITDSETFTYDIILPAGVTNESGETTAEVTVTIEGINTGLISVSDIRAVNTPEGYTTVLTTRTATVTVRGTTEEIEELKSNKDHGIYILVDFTGVTQTGKFSLNGKVVNERYPNIYVVEDVKINVNVTKNAERPTEDTEPPEND